MKQNKFRNDLKITLYFGIILITLGASVILLPRTKTHSTAPIALKINLNISSFDPQDNQLENKLSQLSDSLLDSSQINLKYFFLKANDNFPNENITVDGLSYSAPHGRKELNQNLREMCAFNLKKNNSQWINFISATNKSCTIENMDTCWQQTARNNGYNPQSIITCFNLQTPSLLQTYATFETQKSTLTSDSPGGAKIINTLL